MAAENPTPTPDTQVQRYEWSLPHTRFMGVDIPGYSSLYVSDVTTELDSMFGLDFQRPGELTDEARHQLEFALLFSPLSDESTRVLTYLVQFARNFNFFHAFPYEEIVGATGGRISEHDLEAAQEEGYISVTDHPRWDVRLAAITPKFGSYTLPQDRRPSI